MGMPVGDNRNDRVCEILQGRVRLLVMTPDPTVSVRTDPRPLEWTGPSTLGQILTHLGIRVLDVVAAPAGMDVRTRETVVVGIGEPVPVRPGGVLLAAGSGTDPGLTIRMIREAGEAGYAAVVIKGFGRSLDSFAAAAGESGVALLSTADDMSWRHLDALLGVTNPAIGPASERYASAGVGDLFALANAIAAAVGGALTIEDPRGRVLAYSNLPHQEIDEIRRDAILGLQTPDRPTNYEEYQSVFARSGPILFEINRPDHADRLAVGLWAGRQPLGIMWVISGRPPLAPNASELLADAARVVELHLLRLRGTRDPDRWRRTEALRALLDGRDLGTQRADLGLDSANAARILAIAPAEDASDSPTVPARIVDVVTLLCDSWDARAVCVTIDETVYAMLPDTDDESRANDKVRRLAVDIVSTAQRTADLRLLVAIGPAVTGPAGLPASKRIAERVLRIQRSRPLPSIVPDRRMDQRESAAALVTSADDVPQQVALLAIHDHVPAGEELQLRVVGALLAEGRAGSTPYAETVLAYLGSMGDIARTAADLNVHENTVRYRIKRAEEHFGLDLKDPDTVLVTWLQLRLAHSTAATRPRIN